MAIDGLTQSRNRSILSQINLYFGYRELHVNIGVIFYSLVTIIITILPVISHSELPSSDFTISVDTHEHNHLGAKDIESIIHSEHFSSLNGKHGFADGNPWLKIEWDKNKVDDERYFINNFTPQAYENYYLIKDNKVSAHYSSGFTDAFDIRPIKHFKFVADVKDIDYILIKTCCNPSIPIYFGLLNQQELNENYYHGLIWYAVVYSLITIMIVYNFFIAIYLKENQYLLYCYYLLSMLAILLSLSGIGKQFIWDKLPYIETFVFIMSLNVSVACILFQLAFLEQKYLKQTYKKMMAVIIGLHFVVLFVYFLGFYVNEIDRITNILVQCVAIISWLPMNYIIIRNIMAGDELAKILLFGYMLINIAGTIYVLRYNGYIADIAWTERVVDVAVLCEALILSLALAKKIQTLREEKSLAEEQKLLQQQLFSMELLEIQEKEKRQLSSALHDNFTHQLLILRNNINNKLGIHADESVQVSRILNEIRDLSHLIHPYLLEKLGLEVALSHLLDEAAKTYDLDINFASDDIQISGQHAIIIYRIVQEALNNILQHAHASECLVALRVDDSPLLTDGDSDSHKDKKAKTVNIIIKDDGVGFDYQNKKGLGLKIIMERCQILNGEMSVSSNQQGTELHIRFPYHQANAN